MSTMTSYRQPWLRSASYDTAFVLLPPFLALLVVALLPPVYKHTDAMPVAAWVMLVLLVDVAHVYSTLYNTYLDKARFARQRRLFIAVPVVCYLCGLALHLVSGQVFWRVLAYVAVFHFIRQQYGFMRLYSRTDGQDRWMRMVDAGTIYAATLYPIIYWHCTPGRNFNWFVPGDFAGGLFPIARTASLMLYMTILAGYACKEAYCWYATGHVNAPKNLVIIGTILSWYFGIVYFNGDMAFTLLNVVSHGIPYMALVWRGLDHPQSSVTGHRLLSKGYVTGLFAFIGSLVVLAYLEEGLWDGLVWRDHPSLFGIFTVLPVLTSPILLAILVPLLALPQATHYVLDGFIWRRKYQ